MKTIERRGRLRSEINITPFTDVVLVLLIIFMTTTPILVQTESDQRCGSDQDAMAPDREPRSAPGREGEFDVDLPRAAAGQKALPEAQVVVALLEDGRTVLAGAALSDEELRQQLARLREQNPRTQVVIQADRMVPHWRVVRVLDLAAAAGIRRLGIATAE
ncbi:MAG: biopolymer transporter ExbD [Deltaproteobacteria bacterium]|nr:biopolymer transporter ExbD [Deltaproteobacteria bacterium]